MGRWFSALLRKIFGIFGRKADGLEEDPDVIAATYDNSIKKSQDRYRTTRDAVAKLMSIEDKKRQQLNTLTAEIDRLGRVKSGAAAKAKARVQELQAKGFTPDQIKADAEIIRHQTAFNQADAELNKKMASSKDLSEVLERMQGNLARMKANLESMQRNAESLKTEKQEAIADVVSAKEMQTVNDLVAGISSDTTDKDLEAAREARRNVSNKARLASELAGVDASISDAEYEQAAMAASAGGEFDALIGLETKADTKTLDPARLPES